MIPMSVVQPGKNCYPYCITWSPIPLITWLLPFIGHTGIADSNGVIYDFAGPYTIGVGKMAFGSPTRYMQLNPNMVSGTAWDEAVQQGNTVYSKRMHNLCWDNCHNHVAHCLNLMEYDGGRARGMLHVGVWVFFCAKFTSPLGVLRTYLPFLILLAFILYFGGYFS
mmetsp:Transcript_27586/g.46654  ORF Transcript_27586/g.46654 Transcript_27586/m.46654 type:complete len:166 (+) Transcript_27586:3190-3687(+)